MAATTLLVKAEVITPATQSTNIEMYNPLRTEIALDGTIELFLQMTLPCELPPDPCRSYTIVGVLAALVAHAKLFLRKLMRHIPELFVRSNSYSSNEILEMDLVLEVAARRLDVLLKA